MAEEKKDGTQEESIEDAKFNLKSEMDLKLLWVIIPIAIGGVISMFSNFEQDVQIIIWGVMFLIAAFGMWSHNARLIRRKREKMEEKRWDAIGDKLNNCFCTVSERFSELDDKMDRRFDDMDTQMGRRFDEMDSRFDLAENTDKTLLRSELIRFHREWVEKKGYITLEALEYIDRIHDAYNKVGGNDTGDKLWEEVHRLPIKENRIGDE